MSLNKEEVETLAGFMNTFIPQAQQIDSRVVNDSHGMNIESISAGAKQNMMKLDNEMKQKRIKEREEALIRQNEELTRQLNGTTVPQQPNEVPQQPQPQSLPNFNQFPLNDPAPQHEIAQQTPEDTQMLLDFSENPYILSDIHREMKECREILSKIYKFMYDDRKSVCESKQNIQEAD